MTEDKNLAAFGGIMLAALLSTLGFRALKTGEVYSRGGWYFRKSQPSCFWIFTSLHFIAAFICLLFVVFYYFVPLLKESPL